LRYSIVRLVKSGKLKRIFRPERGETKGGRRKLHNEGLHNLYSSKNIIRFTTPRTARWAGHAARIGKTRNGYEVVVRKSERLKPLGRPKHRWEDNIETDLSGMFVAGSCERGN
jgi:hypothetical protein